MITITVNITERPDPEGGSLRVTAIAHGETGTPLERHACEFLRDAINANVEQLSRSFGSEMINHAPSEKGPGRN